MCGKLLAVHITNNDEEQGKRNREHRRSARSVVSQSETLGPVKRKQTSGIR